MSQEFTHLVECGAVLSMHLHGSLYAHLKGTHDLLVSWGCERHVCLAGLYHSVYGTNIYRVQTLPLKRRREVTEIIGAEAEQLAYMFCIADRPQAFLESPFPARVLDRRDSTSCDLAPRQAVELIEIECANLIEQGLGQQFLSAILQRQGNPDFRLRDSISRELRRCLAS